MPSDRSRIRLKSAARKSNVGSAVSGDQRMSLKIRLSMSPVLNGVLLPVIMIFMLQLINKHELMGKYTNSLYFNIVAWTTAVIVTALSLLLMWNGIHG